MVFNKTEMVMIRGFLCLKHLIETKIITVWLVGELEAVSYRSTSLLGVKLHIVDNLPMLDQLF